MQIKTALALSSGYSQSASLRGSTPNNCSAVYQKALARLLIQASPPTAYWLFAIEAGDLLDLVKTKSEDSIVLILSGKNPSLLFPHISQICNCLCSVLVQFFV